MANILIKSAEWRGPGWYGPVQEGNRITMRFVVDLFRDAESFDRAKHAAGVMTTRFFPDPYTQGSFKEGSAA